MDTEQVFQRLRFYAGHDKSEKGHAVHENTRKTFEAASEAIKALGKASNGGSKSAITYGIIDGLLGEHRYLQSEVIFTLLQALGRFSTLENVTDARNEAAHKTCKRITEFDNLYFGGE